ncbi:hypothetical protein ACWYXJ_29370 [Janthinobacterium lividum]|nr:MULTISPECIES: hypothetical protein [unclassified Janthinobacterium]
MQDFLEMKTMGKLMKVGRVLRVWAAIGANVAKMLYYVGRVLEKV